MSDTFEDVVGLTQNEIDAANSDDSKASETESDAAESGAESESEAAETGSGETEDSKAEQAVVEQSTVNKDPDPFVPEFKAKVPDNIGEQYQSLDKSYNELSANLEKQFEDGDISFTDYRKQTRDLDGRYYAEKQKLDTAQFKADIAVEQSRQIAEQRWQWEQDTFFKDNPDFKADPVLYGALNATLGVISQDEANAGKTGLQLLREAAGMVNKRFGGTQALKETQPAAGKPAAQANRPEMPVTLGGLPAAETNTDAGEFAYMDKLEGLDFEAALAKMPDDKRDRYLMN